MSQESNFLKTTLDLIEANPEVKSYIYQQIMDFNPFVTPDTLVMVVARDPYGVYNSQNPEEMSDEVSNDEDMKKYRYRILVILKDEDTSIEAEAYSNDIFEAIRTAKEKLLTELIEIQNELESPTDRLIAIQQASDDKPTH